MQKKYENLIPEKKKDHVDRCKIMWGVQKWHPFALKIYAKSSNFRFEHIAFPFFSQKIDRIVIMYVISLGFNRNHSS